MTSKLDLRLGATATASSSDLSVCTDKDASSMDKPLTPPATPGVDAAHTLGYSYPPATTATSPITPATSPVTSRPTATDGATFVRQLPPFKIPNFPRQGSFTTFADSAPPTPGTPGTPGPFSPSVRRALLAENPFAAATSIAVLPPTDCGYAWIYLAAAYGLDFLTWGFSFSIGILYARWSMLWPDPKYTSMLSLASSLHTGIIFIAAIVVNPFYTNHREYRRVMQYTGLCCTVTAIVIAAFAKTPMAILGSLGLLFPLGGSLQYLPALNLMLEWFAAKRGVANGVIYCGSGTAGTILPFVLQALFKRFSYRTLLLSIAVAYAMLGATAIFFIRERVPIVKSRGARSRRSNAAKIDWAFLRTRNFWSLACLVALTSSSSFLPGIYVPAFSKDIGLEGFGPLLVALISLSGVIGLLLHGYLSDRYPIRLIIAGSCALASCSSFFLFGFATSLGPLCLFCVVWGCSGSAFGAVYSRLTGIVAGDDAVLSSLVFGIWFLVRGTFCITAGPISTALLSSSVLSNAKFAYGVNNYGPLMLFIAFVNLAAAAVGASYKPID